MFKDIFSISLKTLMGVIFILLGNFLIFLGQMLLIFIGMATLVLGGVLLYLEIREVVKGINKERKK